MIAPASRSPLLAPAFGQRDGAWQFAGAIGLVDDRGHAVRGPVDLRVRDGIIESVSPAGASERTPDGTSERTLVLTPLLVNAHDHGRGHGNVMAGIADNVLEPWIASLGQSSRSTTQERLIGDGCDAMLQAGIGGTVLCVNPQSADTDSEVAAAASVATSRGIRAAIAYPFADAMSDLYGRARDEAGWGPQETQRRLDAFEALAEQFDDPRLDLQLGPVGPQWVSESTLVAVSEHAQRRNRRIHMHLLESRAQREWADRVYPGGIVSYLVDIGLVGPHTCFAHGTHLRAEELEILAEHDCILSINVSSNLRLASGIPPLDAALRSSLCIGGGLDGLALGDDADYWTELRLLRGISQGQSGEATKADELLDRLWRGGSQALGSAAPTRPAVGEVADFLVLDLGPHMHLADDDGWSLADIALAAGRPGSVCEVWVGGHLVRTRGDVPGASSTPERAAERHEARGER